MAKPIRSTPTLRGSDAIKFVEDMIKRENAGPSKFEREIAKSLKKNWKVWSSF